MVVSDRILYFANIPNVFGPDSACATSSRGTWLKISGPERVVSTKGEHGTELHTYYRAHHLVKSTGKYGLYWVRDKAEDGSSAFGAPTFRAVLPTEGAQTA
jgi:hypothetical protein